MKRNYITYNRLRIAKMEIIPVKKKRFFFYLKLFGSLYFPADNIVSSRQNTTKLDHKQQTLMRIVNDKEASVNRTALVNYLLQYLNFSFNGSSRL